MGTRWRGMLAPLDTSTGDGRRFLSSGMSSRELPLPLKWQRADTEGHDTSVVIGSCDTINYGTVAEAIASDWIDAKCVKPSKFADDLMAAWGMGELFTVNQEEMPRLFEDIAEATLLLSKQVIGPSVDAGSADAAIAQKGSDHPLSDQELEELEELFWDESSEDVELEILFTEYQIAAATLVAIPAFAECRPFELLDTVLTAAIRTSGWSDLMFAARDMEWDGDAAEARIADSAGIGGDNQDWASYSAAFLYQDETVDPSTKGAYGFQIVDIVDGTRVIVPRAVFAIAAVLQGARGGTTIPEADQDAMRSVVDELYGRMAQEFEDDTIVVPWAGEMSALIAALTAEPPSYDPELFADPELPTVTPITILDNGEVFGHIATHDTCHVGIPGECVTAPFSNRGYGDFHRYALSGMDGSTLEVGRITTGNGNFVCDCAKCRNSNDDHACLKLNATGAINHHDRLATIAWVRVGEDATNNAIWVHGVLNSTASVDDIASLAKARVSGDWRPLGGGSELVEVLSLSKERAGFPLPRILMSAGRVSVLTAAGVVRPLAEKPGVEGIDYIQLGKIIAGELASLLPVSSLAAVREPLAIPTPGSVSEALALDVGCAAEVGDLLTEVGEAVGAADAALVDELTAELGRMT